MGSDSTRRYVSLSAALLLLITLHLFRPETSSYWLETFLNWLHVPVFALVAVGLFHALGSWRANVNRATLAFAACIALAVLSEAAQIPTSRDASWADILSNVVGAAIGVLAVPTVTDRVRLKVVSRTIAVLLLVISCWPLFQVSAAYVERNRVFPVIYNGAWPTQDKFISQRGMAIDFRNLYPDWSGYNSLVIDVEVVSDLPFELAVRVHDKQHQRGSQRHSDRYNRRFELQPGRIEIRIPIDEIESGPSTRRLDLSRIDGLVLFSNQDEREHAVQLHRIWLN